LTPIVAGIIESIAIHEIKDITNYQFLEVAAVP